MFRIFTDRHGKPVCDSLKKAGLRVGALVFPDMCLNCRALLPVTKEPDFSDQAFFCAACRARGLPTFEPPYCRMCGHVFDTGDTHVCDTCLTDPPVVHRVRAALVYQGLVPEIVPLFKYHARLSLTRFFDSLMFHAFDRHFRDTEIHWIVPVPLHPKKLRQRGFNQSFLLVRRFYDTYERHYGARPGWQVDASVLKRVRYTHSQTGLDIAARKNNLKHAFQVPDPARVKDTGILLVDDVYTTGATSNEAARVLLAAGAARVDVLVLARA